MTMEQLKEQRYLLIDLQRSEYQKDVVFWMPEKMGYTTHPNEAGTFSYDEAADSVRRDRSQKTLAVSLTDLERLIQKCKGEMQR